uniref:Uncharacterized protein n=1 Tax=Arundo donax TaxID=35708 RepID=A0A0A9BTZ1_ARUDO
MLSTTRDQAPPFGNHFELNNLPHCCINEA